VSVASATALADIAVPKGQPSLAGRLLAGPALPRLAARFAAGRTAGTGAPWKFGSTVIAIAHAHVAEALSRDLDFVIAPINAGRIRDVDDAFVLGMDRQAVLAHERSALYRALTRVDPAPLQAAAETAAETRLGNAPVIDVVTNYARPVAAGTAQALFGVTGPNLNTFAEVARSIFGHTFLNLSNDAATRKRAMDAALMLAGWLDAEIARRIDAQTPGDDMMGKLIRARQLQPGGIRRTLAGMLVGSVDTTASAVAKIMAVMGDDRSLLRRVEGDCDDPARMWGWCLEILRRWPHNPILLRHAARDTRLGGTEVRRGDRMILWTQAAMLDACAFPDPDRLRPDRPEAAYLHFGGALHSCAGRSVNRWQIPMLVARLLRRGIADVGAMRWAGSFPDGLQVRFRS
jgi:cytochrome P450